MTNDVPQSIRDERSDHARRFRHVLIVGGTGMLAGASEWLIERSERAVVVGRNVDRLGRVVASRPSAAQALQMDVRHLDEFAQALDDACAEHGPFDLAVVWLHSDTQGAWRVIAERIGHDEQPGRIVAVLSSASSRPGEGDIRGLKEAAFAGSLQRVILGFVREEGGSRWLTHEEISSGVIAAIESAAPSTIVGVVEPWSERP